MMRLRTGTSQHPIPENAADLLRSTAREAASAVQALLVDVGVQTSDIGPLFEKLDDLVTGQEVCRMVVDQE